MTKSTKAILLSAFGYPGAGQIFLKCYTSGIIFIITSTVGLYFILSNTFKITFQIIEDIKNGGAPPDFTTLLNLVSQHDTQLLSNAVTIIITSWLLSIIHAYWISNT